MFAQPRQALGAVMSWDLDDVPDVELNQAVEAGQDPQAFIAARSGASARVHRDLAASARADGEAAARVRQARPAPRGIGDWETEAGEGEDLGLFGPDRPEPEDIKAGEDMSAEAWAADSGEWPPSDPWVRRGLHNLVTRMTEELEAAGRSAPDETVTVRVGDLDHVLMVAVSALYEADARSRQMEMEGG